MRLDQRLVTEGFAPSRARAQALIAARAVRVGGVVALKPAQKVAGEIEVTADPNPWVSRAGLKLDHALVEFGLTPSGVALDIGASTGGFTQVLLERGAAHVHAVDVGHGQLAQILVQDSRVTSHEGVNARDLPEDLLPLVDWITADVSFISLTKALPRALALARPGAVLVALIKPQFEVGRAGIGKGGIVRDPAMHDAACATVDQFLGDEGWDVLGLIKSPISGSDGNREFLIAARSGT